jgi:hypothetical protein
MLNDMGYRMSWSQSRIFAGRTTFLQKAREWCIGHVDLVMLWMADESPVDAYRNKIWSTTIAGGQETVTVAPHLETRVGKRRWQERKKRSRHRASTPWWLSLMGGCVHLIWFHLALAVALFQSPTSDSRKFGTDTWPGQSPEIGFSCPGAGVAPDVDANGLLRHPPRLTGKNRGGFASLLGLWTISRIDCVDQTCWPVAGPDDVHMLSCFCLFLLVLCWTPCICTHTVGNNRTPLFVRGYQKARFGRFGIGTLDPLHRSYMGPGIFLVPWFVRHEIELSFTLFCSDTLNESWRSPSEVSVLDWMGRNEEPCTTIDVAATKAYKADLKKFFLLSKWT